MRLINFLVAVFFLTSGLCSQDTLIMQPGPEEGKDAMVWTYNIYANGGNYIDYRAEEWTYGGIPFSSNSMLEFDLSSLHDSAEIFSVYLSLYYDPISPSNTNIIGHSQLSGPNEAYLSRIVSPWREDEVTWATLPDVTPVNRVTLPASSNPYQDYTNIDITAMTLDALEDGHDFISIMIEMVVPEYYRRLLFCSSDNPYEDKRPKLEIIYEDCQEPLASFDYSADDLTIGFDNTSQYGISYLWDFGDGNTSTDESPVHKYSDYGDYEVCLQVFNECDTALYCDSVNVCKKPAPFFDYNKNNLLVSFTNFSLDADSYTWIFGDGNTSEEESPEHLYENYGDYLVCLETTNSCGTNVYCKTITVCKRPTASFSYETDDLRADFMNTSLDADSYFWDFGNGYYSSEESPYYIFEENSDYVVCLTAINDCDTNVYCETLSFCRMPQVSFECSTDDLHLSIINHSTECDSVIWDFGTGFFTCLFNPEYIYDTAGTYEICLTAFNECGTEQLCEVIEVKEAVIPPEDPLTISLYPNPTISQSYLEINKNGTYKIALYSVDGKKIFDDEIENVPGERNRIYTEFLLPGFYILDVKSTGINQRFNLVKIY
jgi:PKD repeat protein